MSSFEQTALKNIQNLKESKLFRDVTECERQNIYVQKNGKRLISFSCNDYLGLSQHPKVKQAAIDAATKYGAGSGASRFITGNNPLYTKLESQLADMKKTEGALVFGSGYLANIGTIPALVGKGDLIVADKLVHACLLDGAKLSGAKLTRFAHNDMQKCAQILQENRSNYKNCLILTDHVFSMDGDIAPINELIELAEKHDCYLLSDDAHGLGVIKSNFKRSPRHIQMGTLSKAVGCYGGYVCATKNIIDFLKNHARSVIYSTALPPSILATASASLQIISDDDKLVTKPLENAKYFARLLDMPEAQSSIIAIILGDETAALELSHKLEQEGFLVSAIRPPTVAKNTARLRFTFSALHKKEDIERLGRLFLSSPTL